MMRKINTKKICPPPLIFVLLPRAAPRAPAKPTSKHSSMEQTTAKRHSRIDVADVLRGFAVMGIVLLHTIEHYNFYSFPDTSGQCALLNFTDKAIWDGLFFTFGGKAYAIFALLFGFSFFIQDDNQRLQGRDFRLRFCWRLVLLFLLGNLNAAFFTAEVLVLFSIVGFVLVATCRLSDRAVFIIATVCLLQPLHWIYLAVAAFDPTFTLPAIPTAELWNATFAAQSQTSFLEMLRVNLTQGQLAQPRMGLGQRTLLPDRRTLHVRHAHRPPRTLHRGKGRFLAQSAGMVARGILPPLRCCRHAPLVHTVAGSPVVAHAHRHVAAQVRLHARTGVGAHTRLLPLRLARLHVEDLVLRPHEPHQLHHTEHHRARPSSTTGASDCRPPRRRASPSAW